MSDDLGDLIADLVHAQQHLADQAESIVERGCLNIKQDWREGWSGLRHAPKLAAAVNYDVTRQHGSIVGEVGPDKAKQQGALGNLLEFGSANNPPHPAGHAALERETPRFLEQLELLAIRL